MKWVGVLGGGGLLRTLYKNILKWGGVGWVKAKYVRRGEEVERVTQIGTKGTRIENKGAQIEIKGTPNHCQTRTLTKIAQTLT